MARKRKALHERNVNVASAQEQGGDSDHSAQELCRAIDEQVAARSMAIRAICEAQISASLTQLKLLEATFSPEMLQMPVERFVREFCPSSRVVRAKNGFVEIQLTPEASNENVEAPFQNSLQELEDPASKDVLEAPVAKPAAAEPRPRTRRSRAVCTPAPETRVTRSSMRNTLRALR